MQIAHSTHVNKGNAKSEKRAAKGTDSEGSNGKSETKEERRARRQAKKQRKLSKLETELLLSKDSKETVEPYVSEQITTVKPMEADTSGITLLLFYAYVEPEWSNEEHVEAIEWAGVHAAKYQVGGRLRVAREGFNGTITGSYEGIREFCRQMKLWKPSIFGSTDFKLTDNLPEGQAFPGPLKILRIAELVNYGLKGKQPPLSLGGVHLQAKEYHEKMKDPNTVIIDVRNSYEADIGRFNPPEGGAEYIDPEMRVSTEFPEWVSRNKEKLQGKNVMMYCTGGIRCERASALLRQKGLDNIYQMQGGIHRYLEEFKEDGGFWVGKNYTFDKRFAHGADNAAIIGKCNGCKKPWDKYHGKKRCPVCKVPLLLCDNCQQTGINGVCSLCQKQGLTIKNKVQKTKSSVNSCGVCSGIFGSRNELFRHLKDSGHHNRKSKRTRKG